MTNCLAIYVNDSISKETQELIDDLKSRFRLVIFFNQQVTIYDNIASIHGKYIHEWEGDIIATCIKTARYLLETSKPKKRYFYIASYYQWCDPFFEADLVMKTCRNIDMIASSDEMAQVIKQVWNKQPILTKDL